MCRAFLALSLTLLFVSGALAQADPTRRVPDQAQGAATRSVARYLDQERALEESLSRHDRSAVTRWLADDFEARSAASPDTADLNTWLRREFASKRHERLISDLAVREVDGLAVVSFLLYGGSARSSAEATQYVVDLWRQSENKLLARFIDRSSSAPPAPVRPSGRE